MVCTVGCGAEAIAAAVLTTCTTVQFNGATGMALVFSTVRMSQLHSNSNSNSLSVPDISHPTVTKLLLLLSLLLLLCVCCSAQAGDEPVWQQVPGAVRQLLNLQDAQQDAAALGE